MLKKVICVFATFMIFTFSVSAKENFFVYGKNNEKVAQIIGMSEEKLVDYCTDNSVTYFAVNPDNTKQIKKTETVDEFSKQIFDMSFLEDESILSLSSELSGFPDTKGEIVEYESMKFLKTVHETQDSGGKFALTQYITVQKSKKTVISFYTADNADKSYIWENFKKLVEPQSDYALLLLLSFCVFAFIGVWVLVLLIKDFKK